MGNPSRCIRRYPQDGARSTIHAEDSCLVRHCWGWPNKWHVPVRVDLHSLRKINALEGQGVFAAISGPVVKFTVSNPIVCEAIHGSVPQLQQRNRAPGFHTMLR